MDPVLRATGLVKRYKDQIAVSEVSFDVHPGERVALVGPNGAGKTTTLLMLLGVVTPDAGRVELAGHVLPHERSRALAHVGFSAGYTPLAERLRVQEFLGLYGRLYGLRDPRAAIQAGLERWRIGTLADSMCTDLSSGQRTLVGIVKANLHRPRLLVLDEPTASLDPEVALRVRTGLLELCRDDGVALLVTSHNMLEIERLCERVVFILGGRIVADGSPEEIAARFGVLDLEDAFLHLTGSHRAGPGAQETDRPA